MPLPGISKLLEKASNYELISHKVQQAHVVSPAGLQNGASLLKEMRDGDQPGAVSEGLVDDAVSGALRHGGEMPCRRGGTALAERFHVSGLWSNPPLHLHTQGADLLAVLGVPRTDDGSVRNGL